MNTKLLSKSLFLVSLGFFVACGGGAPEAETPETPEGEEMVEEPMEEMEEAIEETEETVDEAEEGLEEGDPGDAEADVE